MHHLFQEGSRTTCILQWSEICTHVSEHKARAFHITSWRTWQPHHPNADTVNWTRSLHSTHTNWTKDGSLEYFLLCYGSNNAQISTVPDTQRSPHMSVSCIWHWQREGQVFCCLSVFVYGLWWWWLLWFYSDLAIQMYIMFHKYEFAELSNKWLHKPGKITGLPKYPWSMLKKKKANLK